MRATDLKALLARAIAARLPVLVVGAPGVGKSEIVTQAAADAGADLILSHPVVEDPTDPKGMPWVVDGEARFLPFGALRAAMAATRPTVWFLDDLGQAMPAVQAAYMQLLLARSVNGHALPDCVTFVAATNRRTDRAGVSGILEPVKSRFATIVELDAHVDDWVAWAIGAGLPAEIVAFLRFRPSLLCAFSPTADMTNSPVPRTWTAAARWFALGGSDALMQESIAGAVGAGAATEFMAFLRLFRTLPDIDSVLDDPDRAPIPTEPATLYAVVTALSMKMTLKNFPRVSRYAERLADDGHGEYASLLMRDCIRRDPAVLQTRALAQVAAGPLGQLMVDAVPQR